MSLSPLINAQLRHDAPFAWVMRDQAVVSPRFGKQDIAEFDQRLEAFLDLIRMQLQSYPDTVESIALDDWGGLFVHALLMIETQNIARFEQLLKQVDEQGKQWRELASALCWLPFDAVRDFLILAFQSTNPAARCAALTAIRHHNAPLNDQQLQTCLDDNDTRVAIQTLRLIGDNKLHSGIRLDAYIDHSEEAICFHAIRAAILLGAHHYLPKLQVFATTDTPFLRDALMLIYPLLTHAQVVELIKAIESSSLSPRIKLYNLGLSGLPESIDKIFAWLADDEFGPVAGDAFAFITGVDIEEDDLSPVTDTPFRQAQEEDHDNINKRRKQDHWAQSYETDLPRPGEAEVRAWWENHQARFPEGLRYLNGLSYSSDDLAQTLEFGNQMQRQMATLALALQYPEQRVVNIKAHRSM
ncbi:MAG: hypothetical protein MI754_05150 [Chromatiales bacterium]|nr:hypothetical protein [Chromatiales bacterium]